MGDEERLEACSSLRTGGIVPNWFVPSKGAFFQRIVSLGRSTSYFDLARLERGWERRGAEYDAVHRERDHGRPDGDVVGAGHGAN